MAAESEVANLLVGQTIKYTFEGAEVLLKLAGKGAKELAILLAALLKDEKKWAGATSLKRMLREGRPMRVIQVPQNRFKEFAQAAKQYGILFNALQQKNKQNGICDIFIKTEDAALVNRVLESTKIACVEIASIDPEVTYQGKAINPTNPEVGNPSAPASGRSTTISAEAMTDPSTVAIDRPSIPIEFPPSVSATLTSLQADVKNARMRLEAREPDQDTPQRRTLMDVLAERDRQAASGSAIHEKFTAGEPLPISPTEGSEILREMNMTLAESIPSEMTQIRFSPTVRKALYSPEDRAIDLPVGITDTDLFFALATEGYHAHMHFFGGSDYRREEIEPLAQFHAKVIAEHCSLPADRIQIDVASYLQGSNESSAMANLEAAADAAKSIAHKIDFHVQNHLANVPLKGVERSILNER